MDLLPIQKVLERGHSYGGLFFYGIALFREAEKGRIDGVRRVTKVFARYE